MDKRPEVLSQQKLDGVESKLQKLVAQAAGEREITLAEIKDKCSLSCSIRTLQRRLHERGVRFRKMREKCGAQPLALAHVSLRG